ncbi:hypothetical protein [Paenibacillus pseudetheri]|uniref:Uncharacterized protein n=1 Tax=Paenibacillus pseudetheri TaxID=2897682 RepID=A0ABN8FF42_9BACL|nr:hypothetical protein [Paenibacillus pseudetheri]CAH1053996.1 hypothetical protein PAECIP111894_00141 [Paenibacillus pseudetheri]
MREEILLTDCPQVLQDRINQIQQKHSYDIISVQKWETTPFKDKTIVMSDFRVFLQYGYEVAIYKSYVTTGGSPLDGEVYFSSMNAAEIITIATKAKWIGDDLRNVLNQPIKN